MKKLLSVIMFLVFCAFPLSLFADGKTIPKGTMEFGLGPVFGITLWTGSKYQNDLRETDFLIGSGVTRFNTGYFIINGLSVGGTISYSSNKVKGAADPTTVFSFGPVVKYYFPIKNRFLVAAKGLFEIKSTKIPGAADATNQLSFGGGGAATYMLNKNIGVYGGLDILFFLDEKISGTATPNTSHTKIDLNAGVTIFLKDWKPVK